MPLFKSGNTEEMDSYRPISILPMIPKIAEEVVHYQLFGYLNVNKTMILPTFDYCDIAWHGCGKVNSDALERLQHRAAQLTFPNSSLDTKELNATLGLVPLIDRRKLHIVLFTRQMVRYHLI